MSLNNLHFNTFTVIPLESPFTRIEADDYGISLYINNTITRTGVDNGQFCDGRPNGALTCVGNGTGFLQFASDMAYLVMMDTMYLCYNRQNSSYRRYVDGLALDSEGYVQTIRNGSYAISAKPMRHRVVREARLQASQKNVFINCPGCTHVEEEESRDDGGDDVQNDPSMPVWEIVLIAVASVVVAASLGVLASSRDQGLGVDTDPVTEPADGLEHGVCDGHQTHEEHRGAERGQKRRRDFNLGRSGREQQIQNGL